MNSFNVLLFLYHHSLICMRVCWLHATPHSTHQRKPGSNLMSHIYAHVCIAHTYIRIWCIDFHVGCCNTTQIFSKLKLRKKILFHICAAAAAHTFIIHSCARRHNTRGGSYTRASTYFFLFCSYRTRLGVRERWHPIWILHSV